MTDLPPNAERLQELVQQLQQNDGVLPETEASELETMLLDNESAREWFVLNQELHAMLEVDKSIRLQLASDLLPDNVVTMPGIDPEPIFDEPAVAPNPEIAATADKDRKDLKFGLRIATSFAAMIAAILGMLWMYSKVAEMNIIAGAGKPDTPKDGNILANVDEKISFHKQVLPILTDNCFGCHGENEENRKAELRLDIATGGIDREKPVIIPGRPENSELIARISSNDPEYFMPPVDSGKDHLSDTEIAILTKWVDQGATYESGWSSTDDRAIKEMARHLATLIR